MRLDARRGDPRGLGTVNVAWTPAARCRTSAVQPNRPIEFVPSEGCDPGADFRGRRPSTSASPRGGNR